MTFAAANLTLLFEFPTILTQIYSVLPPLMRNASPHFMEMLVIIMTGYASVETAIAALNLTFAVAHD